MKKYASVAWVLAIGVLLTTSAQADDLSLMCHDGASEHRARLDTTGTTCNGDGTDCESCTFFRASLDPGKRGDPVGAACQILLGYASSNGCAKVQKMPYADGTDLRMMNPWGDDGGNLVLPRAMLVDLMCSYDRDHEDALRRTCEQEVAAYNGITCRSETEDPTPLSVLCYLGVVLPVWIGCSVSFPAATTACGGAVITWGTLCSVL